MARVIGLRETDAAIGVKRASLSDLRCPAVRSTQP
jgi:hypothetical protein